MGWIGVIAVVPLFNAVALAGILWTLAGGIAYTVGAVFYACGRKVKYIHSVWHAVLFYVI
jgi:hemolysin III